MPLTPEEELELAELKRQRAKVLGRPEIEAFPPGQVGAFAPGRPEVQPTPEIFRPEKLEQIAGAAPETVGAIVGGVLGGIPGAMLGGSAGEAGEQHIRRIFGLGGVPETSLEATRDIALAGLFAGAGEVGGKALGGLLSKLIPSRPLSKSVTREGEEVLEILRPKGITPPPAQVTENRMLDILQNIGEGSLIGGRRITAAKRASKEAIDADIGVFFDDLFAPNATADDIGKLLQDTLEGEANAFKAAGKAKFNAVDDLVGAEAVDFTSVKKLAKEISERKGLKDPKTNELLKQILEEGDTLSFADAHTYRSNLLAVTRGETELIGGQAKGAARELTEIVDSSMETAAKNISDDAVKLWRNATEFWKEGRKLFDDTLITRIINKRPDAALTILLKETTPSAVRDVRNIIMKQNPEAWKGVQSEFLNRIWREDIYRKGVLKTDRLLNILGKNKTVLDELFPKGELEPLKKLARAGVTIMQGQPTEIGRLGIQFAQIGALLHIVTSPGSAFTIILGPEALSRVMTNPRVVNFIISGSKGLKTAQASTKFATQLAAQLAKEDIRFEIKESLTQRQPTMMEKLSQVGEVPGRPIERIAPAPRRTNNRLREALGRTKVIP